MTAGAGEVQITPSSFVAAGDRVAQCIERGVVSVPAPAAAPGLSPADTAAVALSGAMGTRTGAASAELLPRGPQIRAASVAAAHLLVAQDQAGSGQIGAVGRVAAQRTPLQSGRPTATGQAALASSRSAAPARGPIAPPSTALNVSAGRIPVSAVRFDAVGFAEGRAAFSRYIDQALDAMGITDPLARANWKTGLLVAAERESAFNPVAVNRSDSNAWGSLMPDGAPANCSRGVLQTIPQTFATYHQPGTSPFIFDPVANTAAAMNYVMDRYGVLPDASNLAASVAQFNPAAAPRGY